MPASVYREHLPGLGWCPLAFIPSATCQKVWERLSGGGVAHLAWQTRAHSWWELVGNFPVKLALLENIETGMYRPGGMFGQNRRQETHHRIVWPVTQQCGRISFIPMLCTTSSLRSPVDVLTTGSLSTQSHLSASHGAAAQICISSSGTWIQSSYAVLTSHSYWLLCYLLYACFDQKLYAKNLPFKSFSLKLHFLS